MCFCELGASGPLIHQGPSKGLNDPRWWGGEGVCHHVGGGGVVLATKARWARGPHVFWGEAGLRVVSGLVARRARQLGLLII